MHEALKDIRANWLKSHGCAEKDIQTDDDGEFIILASQWMQMIIRFEEKIYLPGYLQEEMRKRFLL